jgi:hypothetical protein
MRRTLVLAAGLVAVSAALVSPTRSAGAQAIPNITAAKNAATNAANAANAHTAAMSNTATPAPIKASAKPVAAPAASKPAPSPAKPDARKLDAKKADAKSGGDQSRAATTGRRDSVVTAGERGSNSTNVAKRGAAGEMTFAREVYSYPGVGRRDPFLSLLKSGDLRPLLSDLKLVTVLYDPTGRNSVAILRDLSTKDQYRVKLGQQLGRMRVAQIQPKQLVFTIEEFGYSRQETLALNDTTSARTR